MSGLSKIDRIISEFRQIVNAETTPELVKLQLKRAIQLLKEYETPVKPKQANKKESESLKRKRQRLENKYKRKLIEKEKEIELRYEKKNKNLRRLLTAKRQQICYYKNRISNMVGAAA